MSYWIDIQDTFYTTPTNQTVRKTRKKHIGLQTDIKAGKGLGDLVADTTHITGLARLAQGYTDLTGKDCGCDTRREKLNDLCSFSN